MSEKVERAKQIATEFHKYSDELLQLLLSFNKDEHKEYQEWDLKYRLNRLQQKTVNIK